MPPRIALACCSRWPAGSGDHAGLAEALTHRGVRTEWVPWDDASTDWSAYDLVLLRETWDYPRKLAAFLGWVDSLGPATSVVNPPAVVRWNHHKRYLRELAVAGIPTVPTTVVTPGAPDGADADTALGRMGVEWVVVKPAVGIGGDGAWRGRVDDPATVGHLRALLAGGDVLVQPYLHSVETRGETSLIVLGGRVSHTVTKLPGPGEFRIHEHRGGTYVPAEASPAQVELALAACEVAGALTGEGLLYARADLVADDGGRPALMELELIEPSLYLHTVPAATDDFADLVVAFLA